jgi:hypothetical protein
MNTKAKTKRRCVKSPLTILMVLLIGLAVSSQIKLNLRATSSSSSVPNIGGLPSLREQSLHNNNATVTKNKSPWDDYDPSRSPVLAKGGMDNLPIKAAIVTISPMTGEAMHFLYDGVVLSKALHLVGVVSLYGPNNTNAVTIIPEQGVTLQPEDADLWIVDGARVAKLKRHFLDQLVHTVEAPWNVLFVDFADRFQTQFRYYQKLNVWDRKHVRVAARSIVHERRFDSATNTIFPGEVAPNLPTAGGPMLHSPYAVRTDIIDSMRQVLQVSDNTTAALADAIFDPDRERPIDILHLWNVSFKEGKSKLRNSVSKVVRSWNGTLEVTKNHRYVTTSIEEQGVRRQVGRNVVDLGYIRALLSAKIVVVTQKDDWEDHYRLFESLSCGALILHDSMVAPPKGLLDEKNIVFFDSLERLEERALHYLNNDEKRKAVARKGWDLAMGRHRSWHRMEELIFGRPLTSFVPEFADLR